MKIDRNETEFEYLGKDKHGLCYYHNIKDNYVYQFDGTRSNGWICSFPAWDRTFHKILD